MKPDILNCLFSKNRPSFLVKLLASFLRLSLSFLALGLVLWFPELQITSSVTHKAAFFRLFYEITCLRIILCISFLYRVNPREID